VRTKWETVDEPAERFHAKCKVFADSFSEGDVRVIIADVDPITNIYDDPARPPSVIRALAGRLTMEHLPSHMYKKVIRCTQ
jgi:hypothetical protein